MSIPSTILRYAGVWNTSSTYQYGMFVQSSLINNSFAAAVATVTGGSDPSVQPSAVWIPFPLPPSGDITSVTAGTGLSGGGSAGNITLANDGVLELTQGTNITISGTKSNYTINSTGGGGVQSVTPGNVGISIGGTVTDPSVLNEGVLELTPGTNITISGTKANYTINATAPPSGVQSVGSGNAGINITGTLTDPLVSNEGVLELTQGTNITISGTKANYTIAATVPPSGVQSVAAGNAGISIGGTAADPTVSNDGVLELTEGINISITGTKSNYTINAAVPPSGVQSVAAGNAGISIGGTAADPTVLNDGVIELTSGTGIVLTGTKANYTITATAPTFDLNAVLNKLNAFPVLPYTASSSQTVAANQVATVTVPDGSFPTASADGHWAFAKAIGSGAYFNWYMYNPRFGNPAAPLPLVKSSLQSCWALIRPTVNLYLAGYLGFNIYSYDPANPPVGVGAFYNTRWAYTNPSGLNSGLSGTNLYAGYTYLIYANDAPRTQNSFAIGVPDSQVSGFRDPYDIYTDVNHIALSQCVVAFNPWTDLTNYKTWTVTVPYAVNDIVVYAGNSGNAAGFNGLFYKCLIINTGIPPMTATGTTPIQWQLLDPQPSSFKDQPVLAASLVQGTVSVQAVGYVVLDMGFSYGTTTTTTSVSEHVNLII